MSKTVGKNKNAAEVDYGKVGKVPQKVPLESKSSGTLCGD